MVAQAGNTLLPPPRRQGTIQGDIEVLFDWALALYGALAVEGNIIGTVQELDLRLGAISPKGAFVSEQQMIPMIPTGSTAFETFPVEGAVPGDLVVVSMAPATPGIIVNASVVGDGQVEVSVQNATTFNITPAGPQVFRLLLWGAGE